ncbi:MULTISPECIES: NAD(P)-dependent oxidoreductase [unclassified Beijerinckia]|uniref:NAD(P)-dependent oxidoreductase n=1 Tax=unclassified Beijerinckia TaxID=2638183 RepID=UPI00089711DD|nr:MULTISPECIES: NAD(P)-dependent oxidoreductase [unclassified Beijerinckia]MDH7795335.1 2-hydroxy-3-oxopropionate reductase [Beijerinckia sp. GAS462]SEB97269.1 tartronate semialdehyde reductase [Beijerinckia sp. 28-YEA-48]
MKTLGFIGTGGMGSGMAANLIKAGYRLVVSDLNRERAKGLEDQGALFEATPKAVAESCELVLSMLPNSDAVRAIALGKGGLVEAVTGAKTWIDFSSIDKETIVKVDGELTKKGWTVADASAGGVEEAAAAGALALWLSGSKTLFDAHQPIFKAMGKSILHVGELGNAKLVKNAMAMLAAVQHMSLVEIGSWLGKGGLDAATFQTIIKNSAQDSEATRRIMDIVVSRKFKPRKSWMPKDVGFGLDMAREMEVPMPFVSLASQMFAIAQATGQDGYEATGIACNVYDVINGKPRGNGT